ncbi:ribosome biogenesis GTPase Der [bacterium]|nr:ribosome biogenesis GTPase Der [bacterium]RQV98399.1 MAG: ribosome biogenesis GTPase Der [bacterium]
MELNKLPIVAIIGRPNVGKSTLFNRLIQRREAIVDDQPGITRDRKLANAEWQNQHFMLMDTGGYIPKTQDVIEAGVTEQVHLAVDEAELILFMVDAKTGITDVDGAVAELLRKSAKPNLLIVNKADNTQREMDIHEFYRLGLGDPIPISASLGRGIGDLLSEIVAALRNRLGENPDVPEDSIKLAIVGRPNAGKSTFVNLMAGQNRILVTEVPGTTRDAVDVKISYGNQDYVLIDTAGLRRRTRIKENVEYYSTLRTQRVVESCDIACVFIDAAETIAQQDMHVIRQATIARKGIILVINKWDLVKDDPEKVNEWQDILTQKLQGILYIPVLKISCKSGFQVKDVMKMAAEVAKERRQRISSPALNRLIEKINRQMQHPSVKGKRVRVIFGTQVSSNPPVFAFFCNYPHLIKPEYQRFIENQIRQQFGFQGVPLTLTFKRK